MKKNIQASLIIALLSFSFFCMLSIEWFDSLSWAISCAMITFNFYDKYLWKYMPGEKTPQIFGEYTAYCESSFQGTTKYESSVKIKQSLSSIKVIETFADGSFCESIAASLAQLNVNGNWTLCYTYQTHPTARPTDDMHYGTALLTLNSNGDLIGSYYTNRLEQTKGTMHLKRKYT